MRYFLQLFAMLGDLMLIAACAFILSENWGLWWLVAITFVGWQKQGGFMAWHPATIRQFMANAKRLGL